MQDVLSFGMFLLIFALVPATVLFLSAAIDRYRNK
jgi:hypothetical protein